MSVSYDKSDPIFKEKRYWRLAKEHISISQLKSDRIKWRIMDTATHLKIPILYEVDYHIKSIIGIHPDQSPIYGDKHTLQIDFPAKFPLETFKVKTLSKIWHPNIKWDGLLAGRVCVNNKGFGRGYDLFWLLLRLGEIIQYKNYLAENIPPYPEDAKVASWIINHAEPNGIVNIQEKIATDNSNLLEYSEQEAPVKKITIKGVKKARIKIGDIKKKNGSK